jgi:hypothetical protein
VKFAYEIDDDDKAAYLDHLRQGLRPNQAATECGYTGTQFRRCRSEQSQYYDPDFAAACEQAEIEGRGTLEERVRDMVWDSAAEGNWNARWKLAVTHLPEFEWGRHSNFNVSVQLKQLDELLPLASRAELEAKAEVLEAEVTELKALPAAEVA